MRGAAGPRRGPSLNQVGLISDAAVLCAGGEIIAIGKEREVLRHSWFRQHKKRIPALDCRHKTVLPGFVDSHTHLAFAGPRLVDFEKRIAGASYLEIARAGGGIRASIAGVRAATTRELAVNARSSLERMLQQGTTTVEAKSGYGLSLKAELKSLEAIAEAAEQWPGTVIPTLLGAHVVPEEFKGRRAAYVKSVC